MKHNQLNLKNLSHEIAMALDAMNITGRLSVRPVGRLFTETMYNGKYHFSQVNEPMTVTMVAQDFNFTLCTNGNMVELFNIAVHKQNQGIGTKIMNVILDAADKCKVRINLNAVPTEVIEHLEHYHLNNKAAGIENFTPINEAITKQTDRLIDFYETFGFTTYGKKFQMIYVPQ